MSLLLLSILWTSILQVLSESPAEDQFGNEVTWSRFTAKPFVLVIGDKEAADRATEIGSALQSAFNRNHIKPEQHLHSTTADEKIKVIAVAALPDVPGIFKGLFRSGFEDEAKTGVILDWDRQLARSCGYRDGTVLIAYKAPGTNELQTSEVSTKEQAIALVTRYQKATELRSQR